MKILFVNMDIGYAGASKMLVSLANFLSERNDDVTLLTYRDPEIFQTLSSKVQHQHKILYRHPIKVIERVGEIIALHRYIKKEGFDVAISFLHPAKYLLVIASKFTKTKVIVAERGDPFVKVKRGRFAFSIIDKITQSADAFVFQTKEAQRYLPNRLISKSVVIPNPVINQNIPKQYKGNREKVIVNVARLDIFQKRQDVLLKAFAQISKKYKDYVLKLYGDGPDECKLKKLAEELGIIDKVYFMGYVKDIYKSISKASVFVLTSDFEGIPNALIEAMSIGMPCISTDCSPGGAKLLIKNNINGLLIPRNNPFELAKSIDYMLSNTQEADRMSCNALNIINEFKEEIIYAKWEKFINETIH